MNMDTLALVIAISAAMGFGFSQLIFMKRIERLEEKCANLVETVKDTRGRHFRYIAYVTGRLNAIEKKYKPKPFTSEDLLKALGGDVERCYTANGVMKSITISAPWMPEPDRYVKHFSNGPELVFDEQGMVQRHCEYALKQLTASMASKTKKK